MNEAYRKYLKAIQQKGADATEVDYRTPFENLLNAIKPEDVKFKVTHEPHREKEFGAPDFLITVKGLPIGYIETKKLDEEVTDTRKTDQIAKYLKVTPNLIITNYRDFLLIKDGKDGDYASLVGQTYKAVGQTSLSVPSATEQAGMPVLPDIFNKRFRLNPEDVKKLERLFDSFFTSKPIEIAKVSVLAEELAKRGKLLKEFIEEELKSEEKQDYANWLDGLFLEFKHTLIGDLDEEGFADAFTQTLIYGLLLAGIDKKEPLNRVSAYANIPRSFAVIHELFDFFSKNDPPERFGWIYDEIIAVINAADYRSISEELMYSGGHHESDDYDPYYYFYEPFLQKMDAIQKKEKGVYYTPIPVVSFIIRSLDKILKEKFKVQSGFLNTGVTTLDFACGTGTFLAEIFKHVINGLKITRNEGQIPKTVHGHILKNFYGFEYLVAPYAVAHLKLARLIEELANGYEFGDKERVQVYLTDTLNDSPHTANPIFQAISKEGREANEIKRNKEILVITGNPPYNVGSKNKSQWLDENMPIYKPEGEKNIQPLSDDYIKFIRFAHFKIAQVERGVVGIITNNSFINGLIHRKMRAELLAEFGEIYILNLHGNARIGESAPDGGKDENVFDIMQGVCISFFVKTGKPSDAFGATSLDKGGTESVPLNKGDVAERQRVSSPRVFYYDLYGKRDDKFRFLRENDINSVEWQELDYAAFDDAFNKTRWGKRFPYFKFFTPTEEVKTVIEYGDAWGMDEIFSKFGSPVETGRDSVLVGFNEAEIEGVFKDLHDKSVSMEELKRKYGLKDTSGWKISKRRESNPHFPPQIIDFLYRPFDKRKAVYSHLIRRDHYDRVKHLILGENTCMTFLRGIRKDRITYFFVNDAILDRHELDTSADSMCVAPLYLYEEPEAPQLDGSGMVVRPNFKREFVEFIEKKYGKKQTRTSVLPKTSAEQTQQPAEQTQQPVGQTQQPAEQTQQLAEQTQQPVGQTFLSVQKEQARMPVLPTKPTPEQIFGYIYAILYCPTYRKKYLELLKIDFPRVPFVDDEALFFELSALGWELVQHHLMKRTYDFISNYPIAGTDEVESVKMTPTPLVESVGHTQPPVGQTFLSVHGTHEQARKNSLEKVGQTFLSDQEQAGMPVLPTSPSPSKKTVRVWINKAQYFDNVPRGVWDFYIGGYKVLDHWLKARKGRTLTNDDITTFHRIVSILDFTIKQMARIEEVAGGKV